MGLRIFLRNWNDFAAKTKLRIFLEYLCRIEVGLTILFPEEKKEEKFGLRKILSKKAIREKELDLQ